MNFRCSPLLSAIAALCVLGFQASGQPSINIDKFAESAKSIPVFLSGFSGEAGQTLKFDLEIGGFELVAEDAAQFKITGNNEASLEGFLVDRVTKETLLSNRYNGGTSRSQAHRFADDVVQKITGRPGIAQSRILFKGGKGSDTEIYFSDYDGANPVVLTRDKVLVTTPAWHLGTHTLYYTSYRSGYPDLYLHDLNTGARRPIAQYPGLNTSPAISPDGTRLAMILSKAGSPDLYVCRVDGSGLKRLTETRQDESSPAWSPDGNTLCFISSAGGTPALYTISAEGGSMRKVKTAGVGSITEPDWSPDGKWIAFTALKREFEICIVPASGGEAIALTTGEDPSWAANSRTIVFSRRDRSKNRRILSLLDVPTKRVKDVAQNLGNCSQPCWAR